MLTAGKFCGFTAPRTFHTVVLVLLLSVSLEGAAGAACDETAANQCDPLAYCEDNICMCPAGVIGDGSSCITGGWTVRFNIANMPGGTPVSNGKLDSWSEDVADYAALMVAPASQPAGFLTTMDHVVTDMEGNLVLTINAIFEDKQEASDARDALDQSYLGAQVFGVTIAESMVPVEPRVYRWVARTSDAAIQIAPVGMTVDSAYFLPDCDEGESGCWVVDITYTTGEDNFNTFYIPHAEGDDALSVDFDYSVVQNDVWGVAPEDTFFPANFPCRTHDYDPTALHPKSAPYMLPRPPSPPDEVTACCIPEFIDTYRPLEGFVGFIENHEVARIDKHHCDGGIVETFAMPGSPIPMVEPPIPPAWNTSDPMWDSTVCYSTGIPAYTYTPLLNGGDPPQTAYFSDYQNKFLYMEEDMTSVECYTLKPGISEGKIDYGCYDNGVYRAWILQQPMGAGPPMGAPPPMIAVAHVRTMSTEEHWDSLTFSACILGSQCMGRMQIVQKSGLQEPFTVVSCTGDMHIAFVTDSWNYISSGFTLDFEIVPAIESEYAAQCNQGGPSPGFVVGEEMSSGPPPLEPPEDFGAIGDWADMTNAFCFRDNVDISEDLVPAYYEIPQNHMTGLFKGMQFSKVVFQTTEDPYIKKYKATVYLDEVELRRKAGMLSGTVGVEHTVDTFIGMANFKPTNTKFLDAFATQVNLHFEKTSFFSVSSHGTNDYTFLQYVNMRLVSVYQADTSLDETDAENAERSYRTSSDAKADYVQVTFTLGDQYSPIETDLIPLDSVLVAKGVFADSTATELTRFHACSDFDQEVSPFASDGTFMDRFEQDCAPNAQMCDNPTTIPDQFVSFNIPLGIGWLPDASSALDSNVFVSMVVSALDTSAGALAGTPNEGDSAQQMKTTLSASIPVVDGGVNIFCDGITAKTDLKDVVNADIVVGSAGFKEELARLTILQDIANTDLSSVSSQEIKTDSIEAGLMTLVIRGNSTYFGLGGTGAYGVQVEDVVTIHIMEPESTKMTAVQVLLDTPGEDNSFSDGLDTNGYTLNGAFRFTIDRAENRVSLEPTDGLLDECSFNPTRPTLADPFPTTCVLRRDMRGQGFPARPGGEPTAIELDPAFGPNAVDREGRDQNGLFMQTVLGGSDYAYDLGRNYSYIIAQKYLLNGRYNRAFWINPGYEWTPSQTGPQSIFTVSQKFILFALINLDEGLASRRRMLLQGSATDDTGAGAGAASFVFETTPETLMAQVYNVEPSRVATYRVSMQLTQEEACMSEEALKRQIRSTLIDYTSRSTSTLETVQVVSVDVSRYGVSCGQRRSVPRRALHEFSSATADVEMLMVFSANTAAKFNVDLFQSMAGVLDVAPLKVSDDVELNNDYINAGDDDEVVTSGKTESSESNQGKGVLIGVLCGVGALLLLGIGIFAFLQMRTAKEVTSEPMEVLSAQFQDLKAQLSYAPAPGEGTSNRDLAASPLSEDLLRQMK
mmetsp:Transcript_47566/g.97251  ORF Transcript_47566/g.97251 Transcript_47566/m.97251 type:complete len:1470 (+) Transcript_47566:139-4548(+)